MRKIGKKKSRYFSGKRTDTQIVRNRYTEDGSTYYERKNGSLYPKDTTIAISRSIKRIFLILERYNKYPNVDEFLLDMLMSRVEARSLPKYFAEHATRDIRLKREARIRAIQKGRFFPSDKKKPLDNAMIEQAVKIMREKERQ